MERAVAREVALLKRGAQVAERARRLQIAGMLRRAVRSECCFSVSVSLFGRCVDDGGFVEVVVVVRFTEK